MNRMSDNFIRLDLTVRHEDIEWYLFGVEFKTVEGTFRTYVYACSFEHASHIVEELRGTARLDSKIIEVIRPNDF